MGLLYESLQEPNNYAKYYQQGDWETCTELARKAGQTQRNIPETVMMQTTLDIQKHGAPAMLVHLLEHIGDLSHRAQEPHGRALTNVHDKIREVERTEQPNCWNLEKEIEEGFVGNAEYQLVREIPEIARLYKMVGKPGGPDAMYKVYDIVRTKYKDQLQQRVQDNRKYVFAQLPAYVQAHQQHNNPVTLLGQYGKEAAILLGQLNLNGLREKIHQIRQWLDKYESLDPKEQERFFLQPL